MHHVQHTEYFRLVACEKFKSIHTLPRFPVSFAYSVHVAQNIGPILIALLQSQTEGNLARVSWFQIFWTTNLKASVALTSNKTMQQAQGVMTHKVAINSRDTLQAGCMVVEEQTGHHISESDYQH